MNSTATTTTPRWCYWHSYTAEEKRAYAIRMQEKHALDGFEVIKE